MAQPSPLQPHQWQLVEDNVALIYYVAQRYRHIPAPAYEDLLSRLRYRLCVCISQWDESRGLKLSSYIVKSLEGEICNHFRDEIWVVRPPRRLREKPLYQLVEGGGEEISEAELQGEDPETLRSCAVPISVDDPLTGTEGEFSPEILVYDPQIEEDVTDRIGGNQRLRLIYSALQPEERLILALQSKGRPTRELETRFHISRAVAQRAWAEVQEKALDLYLKVIEGEPLPVSTGCETIRQALKQRFIPPSISYRDLRSHAAEVFV